MVSLALHAGFLAPWTIIAPPVASEEFQVSIEAASAQVGARPVPRRASPSSRSKRDSARVVVANPPKSEKALASLSAPPAPSAEEWQLASTYTLRNSKRYRHNWGQLVRSKMGTAVEGPDQGMVRFRIEIAPDGKIAKVQELWSTSALASRLAQEAIRSLPPLPPTPTGKPSSSSRPYRSCRMRRAGHPATSWTASRNPWCSIIRLPGTVPHLPTSLRQAIARRRQKAARPIQPQRRSKKKNAN